MTGISEKDSQADEGYLSCYPRLGRCGLHSVSNGFKDFKTTEKKGKNVIVE
jgi:hypothetical protein